MRWLLKGKFKLFREQRGFSLIEILVALALLSMIGVAFLNGLFTTSKAVTVSQESVTAESLARSQMEYVKVQDYILFEDYDPDDPLKRYELIDIPADLAAAGYTVDIITPVVIISKSLPDKPFELQSVTVVVKRNGKGIFTLSVYKVEG